MQHKNESKDSLQKIWKATDSYKAGYQPDVEKGLARLKTRINSDKKREPAKIFRINWPVRIAASVAILIACGFLFDIFPTSTSVKWEQIATTDSILEAIDLPDGSKVWVNQHSQLSYPAAFSASERLIKLEGEAFFQVAKNRDKPFVVQMNGGTIKVLGTEFNVRNYANEAKITVEVEEGSVQFNIPDVAQKQILKANDKIVFDKTNATFTEVEALKWSDIAWKQPQLVFEDKPITEVLNYVAHNFGLEIDFSEEKLQDCPFNATLLDNQPEAILKSLDSTFPSIKLKKVHSKYYQLIGHCD